MLTFDEQKLVDDVKSGDVISHWSDFDWIVKSRELLAIIFRLSEVASEAESHVHFCPNCKMYCKECECQEKRIKELESDNTRLTKLAAKLRDRCDRMWSDWITKKAITEGSEMLAHTILSETFQEFGEKAPGRFVDGVLMETHGESWEKSLPGLEPLFGVPINFWVCPDHPGGKVIWQHIAKDPGGRQDIATCEECGRTNQ